MFCHVDADSFFASVLVRKHPELAGKLLLAAGMGGGCVIAASYEAKAFGVRTGMPLREARKLCPGAIEMPADFRETGIASQAIEDILKNYCPLIQQYSIDEWYLDLTSMLGGTPQDLFTWAKAAQAEVLQKTALSVSIGVGPTMILAKMAGEYRKPAGICIVGLESGIWNMGNVPQIPDSNPQIPLQLFLSDRPAAAIPGIGRKRTIHTDRLGLKTAWDFACADLYTIKKLFGKTGVELQSEIKGTPMYQVTTDIRPPKSISRCRTFKPTADTTVLLGHLARHLEYTVLKMRRWKLACSILCVHLRDKDYEHSGQCIRVSTPSQTDEELWPYAKRCFGLVHKASKRYNQVSVALCGLIAGDSSQQSLFTDRKTTERREKLQQALDRVHERFGRDAITRGCALDVRSGTRKEIGFGFVE